MPRITGTELLRIVFVGIAYFASARIGYALAIGGGMIMMWPPSGLMLGLLAMAPNRHWLSIILSLIHI